MDRVRGAEHLAFLLVAAEGEADRAGELRSVLAQHGLVDETRIDDEVRGGIEDLDGDAGTALDRAAQRREVRAAAAHVHGLDFLITTGGQVEVERALDLAGETVAGVLDHELDLLRDDAARRPAFVGLGLLERDVRLLLDLFGDRVTGVGDLARERRHAVGHDVDRGDAGAHVDERDGARLRQALLRLEHVLQGERVGVDDEWLDLRFP